MIAPLTKQEGISTQTVRANSRIPLQQTTEHEMAT
jgi:hypothetical protein